jgi:hypothetical protein
MSAGISEKDALQFERASLCVPSRIAGGRWLRRIRSQTAAKPVAETGRLDSIIDSVAQRVGVSRAELVSPSRRHSATVARALVAWHAIRSGLGTLNDVSRVLGRHPSTLTVAISRYRNLRADLFNEPLRHADPNTGRPSQEGESQG